MGSHEQLSAEQPRPLDLRASGRYLSSREGHLSAADAASGGEQYVDIKSQTIGDVSLAWASSDHRHAASEYCRNVGDNNYISNVALNQTGPRFTQVLYDPRTYGVTFGANF